jgi:hypothetical protein
MSAFGPGSEFRLAGTWAQTSRYAFAAAVARAALARILCSLHKICAKNGMAKCAWNQEKALDIVLPRPGRT